MWVSKGVNKDPDRNDVNYIQGGQRQQVKDVFKKWKLVCWLDGGGGGGY